MVECPNCHELTAPHKVCSSCGFYDGKEVLKDGKLAKEPAKKADAKAQKTESKKKTLSNLVVKKREGSPSFCFN